MKDANAEGEIPFDQSERLTARLRDLVRHYPKGPGLVKEFLQNADDAGARKLLVVLDRRTHDAGALPPNLRAAQGPALLFFNDRVFSEDDFKRIQQVGAGGKVEEAAGTGRFGHGFNTCYSVSDHPSLLTGERVAWFDPHHNAACRDSPQNARAWLINSKAGRELLPWLKTFSACGWDESDGTFDGTTFRLPLRSAESAPLSEISKEPFVDNDFEEIIEKLREIGAPLLLFLRSVLELEVREVDPSGRNISRFSIRTVNTEDVESARAPLRSFVSGRPRELLGHCMESASPLPVAAFDHRVSISEGTDVGREETWAVVTGLFSGTDKALLKAAIRVTEVGEKAMPWAGAATRISSGDSAPNAGLACFLPLPGSIHWPIWIHGWFDLPSNRQGITRSREAGISNHARYDWNELLMRHAAGCAWALLLKKIAGDAKYHSKPYRLWPGNHSDLDGIDAALVNGFYHSASELPILRARLRESWTWCKVDDGAYTLDVGWHDELIEAFSTEGWRICDPPVPPHVVDGFASAGRPIPQLTPGAVRAHLSKAGASMELPSKLGDTAPLPMLRTRGWVVSIAEFCSEEHPTNLAGLPLALRVDQQLDRFGKEKRFYLVPKHAAVLLERLPQRRLSPPLLEVLAITEVLPELGLRQFDVEALLHTFDDLHLSDPKKKEWLAHAFKFLASCGATDVAAHKEQLMAVDWVPDQRGKWHGMGFKTTPLIPRENQHQLLKVLKKLGVPLLEGSDQLVAACTKFSESHSGHYLWPLTPTNLADVLDAHVEEAFLDEPTLDDHANLAVLLNFLSSDSWFQEMTPDQKGSLRKLKMLRTHSGVRVSADTRNLFVPSGFQPPSGIGGQFQLIETGTVDQWKPLLQALGIRELDGATFIREVLLSVLANPELDTERRFTFLEWLRDQHRAVATSLTREKRAEIFKAIQAAEILPVSIGGLASPARTYAWDAKKARDVLGNLARTPERKFFQRKQDLWEGFFAELELPSWPLPSDILSAIKHLQSVAKLRGASAAQPEIEKVARYLSENWGKLSGVAVEGNKTMAACLSELPWLPAHRDPEKPFAACKEWEDQLWKPCELLPKRDGHLAASKYPICGLSDDLSEVAWKELGGKSSCLVSEMVAHYLRVIEQPLGSDQESSTHSTVFTILRRIGIWDAERFAKCESDLRPLLGARCVPIKGKWHQPKSCFIESVRPPVTTLQSWTDSSQTREPMLINGLRRLGVRQTPEVADWVEVLEDIAEHTQDDVLPESSRKLVRKICASLLSFDHETLSEFEVPILLVDGRLHPGSKTFLLDDPRLKRSGNLGEIPLVEDYEETRQLAVIAGATPISSVVRNRLGEGSSLLGSEVDQAKLDDIRSVLRSSVFHNALRRLRYHESLDAGEDYQNAKHAGELLDEHQVNSLRLQAATKIVVKSAVTVDGHEIVLLELSKNSFHDTDIGRLYFCGGTQSAVKDEVAETICRVLELKSQLKVRALLEQPVERMDEFLDEEGIASPLPDTPRMVPVDQDEDLTEWPSDDHPVHENEAAPPEELEGTDDNVEKGHGEPSGVARNAPDRVDPRTDRGQAAAGRTPGQSAARSDRPGISTGEYDFQDEADEVEDFSETEDGIDGSESMTDRRDPLTSLPPRRVAGVDSETSEHGASMGGSRGKGRRPPGVVFRSMTQREGSGEEPPERAAQRKRVDALAVQLVVQKLRVAGWSVTQMAHDNPGYDLEVNSPGGDSSRCEYWEVKGLSGAWSGWAVTMSATQLDYNHMWAAKKEGGRFSLVVVANVGSPNPSIYRIRNPFGKIQGYFLDGDWSVLHEPFLPGGAPPPTRPRRT